VAYGLAFAVLLSAIATIYALFFYEPQPLPGPSGKTVYVPPKPKTEPSKLTGLQVKPEVNKRQVTAVMIENSTDARPQSGLNEAGVVFEAIAEGGITRFMALYQDTEASNIGPVRSARPYYVEWALGFDAAYAHVGGSPEALQDIRSWHVKDLDQFYNPSAYHRISTRYAPHNMYTSSAALNKLESAKGYKTSTFTGLPHKLKEEKPTSKPTVASIDMNFSGPYYNTHYRYDPKTNSYLRSMAGAPHTNDKGKQINPKVVIALIAPYGFKPDGYHSDYKTIGTGQLLVFQDGKVTKGTWLKSARDKQFNITDSQGHALKLNPGQTWIGVLGSSSQVTYKP
jgi:hypothetical protein